MQAVAGLLHDVDQVAVVVRRVGAVDAHDDGLFAEVMGCQGIDDQLARIPLLALGDGVLEVEEDLVGLQ